jgi:hypothetical protein
MKLGIPPLTTLPQFGAKPKSNPHASEALPKSEDAEVKETKTKHGEIERTTTYPGGGAIVVTYKPTRDQRNA